MGLRQCAVCKRSVPQGYESDHVAANHLGPHVFWFNMRKYQTMEPSMTALDLKKFVAREDKLYSENAIQGFVFEDRGKGWDHDPCYTNVIAIDLTQTPHFYTMPGATMHRHPPLD